MMIRSIKTVMVCAVLGAVTPVLAADGFDYNYVEAGWVQTHENPGISDGSGFGVGGSVAFTSNFHAVASYLDQDFSGVKLKGYEAGFGFNRSLTSGLDLVGRATYLRAEGNAGFGSVTDNGYGLSMLVRGRLLPRFELGGGIAYAAFRDLGNSTAFNVNGVYSFTDHLHAVGGFSFGDGVHVVQLGVRYSFGQ